MGWDGMGISDLYITTSRFSPSLFTPLFATSCRTFFALLLCLERDWAGWLDLAFCNRLDWIGGKLLFFFCFFFCFSFHYVFLFFMFGSTGGGISIVYPSVCLYCQRFRASSSFHLAFRFLGLSFIISFSLSSPLFFPPYYFILIIHVSHAVV
ncbi:hypothetical protein B0T19DRAFT_408248 [Cercophora scortea]|uniref:Uncharacterized protein n=1 Tax=Cercophora scortea TaxID=314031 RepID=A0AAE0J3L8_9PEZI|nr:hypothetical protein B0T19DRAFT_408248 [Cercophora scortea]